jgi:hypothetical protein
MTALVAHRHVRSVAPVSICARWPTRPLPPALVDPRAGATLPGGARLSMRRAPPARLFHGLNVGLADRRIASSTSPRASISTRRTPRARRPLCARRRHPASRR